MKARFFIIGLTVLSLCIRCSGEGSPTARPNNPNPVAEKVDPESVALQNHGVGPITSVEMGELDIQLVESGKALFEAKCTACHKIDKKYIGPALMGVTERRTPEWVMNMILNPSEMIAKDPLAKKLVGDSNGAVMADQSLTEEEARSILEYLRTH
ncbi:MAG: cytochrome c [Bacteroidetes bacterium]|uniref:Cytochrome c n=1 Tax=Phaeocystidibacter marisrubri TaxID=1577780 RepID=A0A6L3ZFE2_9FLAO|nr:cytochrome c [Phaeocystidibacter marisrubri]KAB2816585.1 cytochrome c [Phaeocystidibacter marisrubri]TNE28824.1 MAG: cytochrome c [Bacteroidota bacterium]GGH69797.1 hypothetical protein GCM10011318_11190 [Phaeocystidibacter marisrubri]